MKKAIYDHPGVLNDSTLTTLYVRDAGGNIMTVYREVENATVGNEFYIMEQDLYGSSRLGTREKVVDLNVPIVPDPDIEGVIYVERGYKKYELSNHLGNVLMVISDRREGMNCTMASNTYTYYEADILMATDYYPFGSTMPQREWSSTASVNGFNGMRKDDEWQGSGNHYTTEFRQYDPRLGRWMALDPDYRHTMSNYVSYGNCPIVFIDPYGNTDYYAPDGTHIGSDGKANGANLVLYDKKEIKRINKQCYKVGMFWRQLGFGKKQKGLVQVDEIQGKFLELPSEEVIKKMVEAVDRSNQANDKRTDEFKGDDFEGGFHEEGGYWGLTEDGEQKVVDSKPGDYADPRLKKEAEIKIFTAAREEDEGSIKTVQGTFHVHPSGTKYTVNTSNNLLSAGSASSFDQPPSKPDYEGAERNNISTNYVLGAGNNTVYVYNNEKKITNTFSYSIFTKIASK